MTDPPTAFGLVPAPAALVKQLEPWAAALRRTSGAAFRALYLYGSALGPHFDAQQSDVNLLLVVEALSFTSLGSLRRSLRELAGEKPPGRRVVPLVLSEAQIRASVDVFPAEFLDLRARRALLAGTDVLGNLEVGLGNLRHQCEYELRAKLIGLRQGYLLAGDDAAALQRLLAHAAGGLAAVLRQLVHLADAVPPDDAMALVAAVAERYGVDAAALAAPFEARRLTSADAQRAEGLFAAHLHALETLIGAADAHPAR
jgi:hypothetical protein